jgi:hypothetical protein
VGRTAPVLLNERQEQELLMLVTFVKVHRKATKTVHNKGSDH